MIESNVKRIEENHAKIETNIDNAYIEADKKGATLPVLQNSENLAETIASIPQGSNGDIENKIFVRTENAILRSSFDSSINGKMRALVNVGTSVWVDAQEIENNVFNCMKDARGEIVTYSKSYNMNLSTDNEVIPEYSANEVESKSVVHFQGRGYRLDFENTTVIFFVSCDVLDSDEKKEWGILLTTYDALEDEIGFGKRGTKFEFAESKYMKRVTHTFTYINPAIFSLHRKLKLRAYCIIEKDGVEEIIYSKMITIQL